VAVRHEAAAEEAFKEFPHLRRPHHGIREGGAEAMAKDVVRCG